MSYEPKTWVNGEFATVRSLNNIEQGIADADSEYVPKEWQCGEFVMADDLNHIEQGIQQALNRKSETSIKPISDVNFIDYDGTIVESYTTDEFLALSAMPDNPSHDGLVAQGWNWSFADAQDYVEANDRLVVGQTYSTDNGATRLYVRLSDGRLHPYVGINLEGTVNIDWGDGSETDTLTGSSKSTPSFADHEYASNGDYVISISVLDGSFDFSGTTVTSYILRKSSNLDTGSSGTPANEHRVYADCLHRVEVGSGANIGNNAFYNCASLSAITIPDNITTLGNNAFYGCYSLKSITIPSGVVSLGSSLFNTCYTLESIALPNSITDTNTKIAYTNNNLKMITIPSSVTLINTDAFAACHALASIVIPSGVANIGKTAFANCYGLSECRLKSSTPPLITATTFSSIPADCKFIVPQGSLSAYQSASNWSTYASRMQEATA